MHGVVWLTAPSGAGKTTLAKALLEEIPCVNLDGNEMRDSISETAGFSREDRREHNLRVARLAKVLSEQVTVVVSVIAPMKDVRDEIDKICQPIWIYLKRDLPERKNHFYEVSEDYEALDVDNMSIPDEVKRMRDIAGMYPEEPISLFPGRFQVPEPHPGHLGIVQKLLDEGKKVTIALRDTAYSEKDPYTIGERKQAFKKVFGDKVNVIVIPDIEEIAYGRGVGYGIREISLPAEIEAISATAIRKGGEKES